MPPLVYHPEATLPPYKGPFYPPSMQRLADVVAAARPEDSMDLDMIRWCQRAGAAFRHYWGIPRMGDGYKPWWAIQMLFCGVTVFLVLPQLVTVGESMSFKRMPSLFVDGDLSEEALEQLTASLADVFAIRQYGGHE